MPSSTPPNRKALDPQYGSKLAAISVLIGYTVLMLVILLGYIFGKPQQSTGQPAGEIKYSIIVKRSA